MIGTGGGRPGQENGDMRFGIVGTGRVSDWFVAACRRAGGLPTGVVSRDLDRGQAFAHRHGLGLATTSLEELAASDAIDAVYVASPIGSHRGHVLTALERGKHVLCEKTLGTSPDEVLEMFDSADRNGRVLLEAVRPVHDPAYQVIAGALERLGTLRHAHLEKCQYSSRYPAYLTGEPPYALDPTSGGSALRDIGVYCLHPSLLLFGPPLGVVGTSYHLPNGFEAGGTLLLDHGDLKVSCTYSKVTRSATPSVIQGERGTLLIDSVADPAQVVFVGLDGRRGAILDGPAKRPDETLHHPVEEFLALCAAGDVRHRFREPSVLAESVMTRALHGWERDVPAFPARTERPVTR